MNARADLAALEAKHEEQMEAARLKGCLDGEKGGFEKALEKAKKDNQKTRLAQLEMLRKSKVEIAELKKALEKLTDELKRREKGVKPTRASRLLAADVAADEIEDDDEDEDYPPPPPPPAPSASKAKPAPAVRPKLAMPAAAGGGDEEDEEEAAAAPAPTQAKAPASRFSQATTSATVFAGTSLFTTSMLGTDMAKLTGAKSFSGS
jgi:hypothetical protein